MSRQEAEIRSRLDPRATLAIAVWGVVAVSALFATIWHAAFSEAASISWFGLCAGTTLASALNLFADVKFHESSLAKCRDGNGSLPAFLVTVLIPFVPAAILISEPTVVAVGYLVILFAFVSLVAWSIGERRDYLRVAELYRLARGTRTRATEKVAAVPIIREQAPPVFESTARLAKPSIVILPQPRTTKIPVAVKSTENLEPTKVARTVLLPDRSVATHQPGKTEKPPVRKEPSESFAPRGPSSEPKVSQWIKRCLDDAGTERIEGSARIEFASGQKQATLHVPFVPALPAVPQVEAYVLDGAPVRLKIGFAQSFGVRIEARRSDSAQTALIVDIGFTAVPTGRRTSAA